MPEEITPSKQFVPYLVIVDGPRAGTRFQLREGENPVGRSASGVAMLEDQSVSRKHALLTHGKAGWVLADLGSKNGTSVNGQRVKDPVTIGHGDVIQVGIYALRLIAKPVSSEEEMAPLPSDVEGKTIMYAAGKEVKGKVEGEVEGKTEETSLEVGGDTKTMVGETGEFKAEEGVPLPPEPSAEPEKRKAIFIYGGMGLALLTVAIVGGYSYWKFLRPTSTIIPAAPTEPQVVVPEAVSPPAPKTMPVFLDFASSPLPARVVFEGKDYGLAPIKVNVDLEIGKSYTANGTFTLDELQDERIVPATITVDKDSTTIPVFFKGQIGLIKITSLPRDTQLYIEGYYAEDPFKPHTAKLTEVVFGKPMYVPYGKYTVELRQPKQIGESSQFVEDIRFKREFSIVEDSPIYELTVTEEDLQKFPVEIRSTPEKADVFIDSQLVGQTPYDGIFPLGEHTLTLRKDGYFEHTQNLKMDINTPYHAEIELKTTAAGQFINAGDSLLKKGLYQEAIKQFSESFENAPTARETAQAQYLLGLCYLQLGDTATAAGYFEQARMQDDFRHQAMLGLASIYGKDTARSLPLLVEVMLKSQDEQIKRDATAVFKQISPLRSVMYIYTDPPGATVLVNDKTIEQQTPLILHDLGLGNYKIRIKKDGFVSQELNINMSVAEFNPVIIKLKPVEE